ncbi:RNA polymerase sigma factor [Subtercola lobariae]|uniref:RNA polymerase sigma24 factor n=1 Tax=Subtercola lobariae TaxID=1588641 RepID=A0A917BDV6_9MICO|nr:sigma-70 family RNA polymerase sigma factor [Subtercola lobariae]GGF37503.1 RNA polymerase sigma24 factor [Subtercola lobariae]
MRQVGAATVDLLRELAPQVIGLLTRRYGNWASAEDATQEALIAASTQWGEGGVPEHPKAWLVTVATRRLVDEFRSDGARREREAAVGEFDPEEIASGGESAEDDSLTLLFLCCHPALSTPSQLALTLRAVGGLTTAEIARAFLVPESTMAQRISRAKAQLRALRGEPGPLFSLPPEAERAARLAVVLQVLYLIFNEGYTPGSRPRGTHGDRSAAESGADLTTEAIRLARLVHHALPENGEASGLLALMLLTDARRPASQDADGMLVALADQDRSLWRRDFVAEGTALLTRTLGAATLGPYQLQAAIAAVHDEAPDARSTDWAQILALYGTLERISPGAVVTLNKSVAVAMVHGPRAGLAELATIADDPAMRQTHRFDVVRGHLLELAGDAEGARGCYRRAIAATASTAEQRYLALRAARLGLGAGE